MPKYRALIEGRNFLLSFDGKVRRHGFYQTVHVESPDPAQAETDAIHIVKGNAELKQLTQNDVQDPPMLYLASLDEFEDSAELPANPKGRTYFAERQWWQFWK